MYNAPCILYRVQYTVYSVPCTVHGVQCTVYSARCKVIDEDEYLYPVPESYRNSINGSREFPERFGLAELFQDREDGSLRDHPSHPNLVNLPTLYGGSSGTRGHRAKL